MAYEEPYLSYDVDACTVMELMGHAHVSMSVGYARSNDTLKREAFSKVGDEIGVKK